MYVYMYIYIYIYIYRTELSLHMSDICICFRLGGAMKCSCRVSSSRKVRGVTAGKHYRKPWRKTRFIDPLGTIRNPP